MALTPKLTESLLERGYSRRQIGRIAMGAGAAIPFFNEFAMAQQAEQQTAPRRTPRRWRRRTRTYDPEVVRITSNENPMGPCKEGLEALIKVAPMGWRYSPQGDNLEFNSLLASTENVPQDHVIAFPGSSIPLANSARRVHFAHPKLGDGRSGLRQRRGPLDRQRRPSRFRCAKTIRTTWKR